jgi:peptide-methionine (S)-S-oxide reductase
MNRLQNLLAAFTLLSAVAAASPARAQEGLAIPAPAVDEQAKPGTTETAVLAGGCFWGVQGVFQHVEGVKNAVSGYAGGDKSTAEYETVGTGKTGHAESVKITYDPAKITYGKLLQIYFSVAHDPTQLNYQGPDHGTQYRSAIFPQNEEQAKLAAAYIAQLNAAKIYNAPIVTKIEPGKTFYPAEDYHQDFLTLHPTYPYIFINDIPKIRRLKKIYPELFRQKPALVSESKS